MLDSDQNTDKFWLQVQKMSISDIFNEKGRLIVTIKQIRINWIQYWSYSYLCPVKEISSNKKGKLFLSISYGSPFTTNPTLFNNTCILVYPRQAPHSVTWRIMYNNMLIQWIVYICAHVYIAMNGLCRLVTSTWKEKELEYYLNLCT